VNAAMKRTVETIEDFKLRIAAIVRGNREEHVAGARRPNPVLARKK